jgi:hypothetical protein
MFPANSVKTVPQYNPACTSKASQHVFRILTISYDTPKARSRQPHLCMTSEGRTDARGLQNCECCALRILQLKAHVKTWDPASSPPPSINVTRKRELELCISVKEYFEMFINISVSENNVKVDSGIWNKMWQRTDTHQLTHYWKERINLYT